MTMQILADYFALQRQIYQYFGYEEDWRVIPLSDNTVYYWRLDGEGPGKVHYAGTEQELRNEAGDYYVDEIYT